MDTSVFSYASAKKAQETFSDQQIDNLLDIIYSRSLSESEKDAVMRAVLPNREHHSQKYADQNNKELVTTDFAQQYANYRAMGLSQKDAANLCGITLGRLNSLLHGTGLTRKQHQLMLTAEQGAVSRFKHRNLSVMHDAAQDGKWQAAQALLEKVLPDEYGKRMEVHNSGTMRLSVDECESMAQKAADDLQRLRIARQQEQQNKALEDADS